MNLSRFRFAVSIILAVGAGYGLARLGTPSGTDPTRDAMAHLEERLLQRMQLIQQELRDQRFATQPCTTAPVSASSFPADGSSGPVAATSTVSQVETGEGDRVDPDVVYAESIAILDAAERQGRWTPLMQQRLLLGLRHMSPEERQEILERQGVLFRQGIHPGVMYR